jgi:hypothetical protein
MVPERIQPSFSDRVAWPLVLIPGLVGGLAWGVFARVWMRFISTDPQFTWNGTLFIVIGFGIAGLAQSAAFLGRRANLRRRQMTALRVATFASLLPLGMAAGGPAFPIIVLAPLALTHIDWSRRTRVAVGAVALLPVLFVARILSGDLPVLRTVVGFMWFLVIYAGIVWAAGFTLAPQLDGWRAPRAVRVVGLAALSIGCLLSGFLLIGVQD